MPPIHGSRRKWAFRKIKCYRSRATPGFFHDSHAYWYQQRRCFAELANSGTLAVHSFAIAVGWPLESIQL
jgi:hypothetical protein